MTNLSFLLCQVENRLHDYLCYLEKSECDSLVILFICGINREVKISLRQRQRVRERNFCVLTSSFLVFFLGSYSLSSLSKTKWKRRVVHLVVYKSVTKTTAIFNCRSRTRCRCRSEILTSLMNSRAIEGNPF